MDPNPFGWPTALRWSMPPRIVLRSLDLLLQSVDLFLQSVDLILQSADLFLRFLFDAVVLVDLPVVLHGFLMLSFLLICKFLLMLFRSRSAICWSSFAVHSQHLEWHPSECQNVAVPATLHESLSIRHMTLPVWWDHPVHHHCYSSPLPRFFLFVCLFMIYDSYLYSFTSLSGSPNHRWSTRFFLCFFFFLFVFFLMMLQLLGLLPRLRRKIRVMARLKFFVFYEIP